MGPEVQQYDESVKGLHTRRRVENAEWTFADYLSVISKSIGCFDV